MSVRSTCLSVGAASVVMGAVVMLRHEPEMVCEAIEEPGGYSQALSMTAPGLKAWGPLLGGALLLAVGLVWRPRRSAAPLLPPSPPGGR